MKIFLNMEINTDELPTERSNQVAGAIIALLGCIPGQNVPVPGPMAVGVTGLGPDAGGIDDASPVPAAEAPAPAPAAPKKSHKKKPAPEAAPAPTGPAAAPAEPAKATLADLQEAAVAWMNAEGVRKGLGQPSNWPPYPKALRDGATAVVEGICGGKLDRLTDIPADKLDAVVAAFKAGS